MVRGGGLDVVVQSPLKTEEMILNIGPQHPSTHGVLRVVLELGAMTPMFYAFREREMIQHLMESCTGARMHHSYVRVGGLKDDLPRGFLKEAADVLTWIRAKLRDFENLIMGNEIIFARTKNVGVLPPETAVAYGCSGPVLQASGVPMGLRMDDA